MRCEDTVALTLKCWMPRGHENMHEDVFSDPDPNTPNAKFYWQWEDEMRENEDVEEATYKAVKNYLENAFYAHPPEGVKGARQTLFHKQALHILSIVDQQKTKNNLLDELDRIGDKKE